MGIHARAVSQKTRKKTSLRTSTARRGGTKARARTAASIARTTAAKRSAGKSSRNTGKSSRNKRGEMPSKTARASANTATSKTAASKTVASASKTAASKAGSRAAASKTASASKVGSRTSVKPAAKPAAKAAVASKPAVKPVARAGARVEEPKKVLTQRQGFKTGEFVVYPAHGVGQILAIEEQEIAGAKLELFVINFIKDKMTLRVPTAKVANVGMRKLSDPGLVKRALETLKGRARIKRTMWSRRAQEYEAKINSGDIVAIAEVVRDLYRSESQPEQSYSERQLYEAALDRLSREIAVVQHVTETEAVKEIEGQLAKSPRRGAKAEAGAEADGDLEADGDDAAVADEAA
ncbi:CarD family transcriptional regulator [Nitrobacter sp. TKz-YC01]|uniref:CarD family transcriptional regulator n=2 Tax=unclassified Nitrobacter TaxID=2620411 RepID=UPI003A102EBA